MIRRFAYHRSIAPMLGVLLALALVETAVVHLVLVALWGWRVAVPILLLDLTLVVALVRLLRAFRRLPVTLDEDVLTMRVGRLKVVPVPIARIAGLRDGGWDAAALKARGVVNLALAAWPNVMIDLSPPIVLRGRAVHAVAHKLDDPAAFTAALATARERLAQPAVPSPR